MSVSNVDKHTKEGELSVRLCNYIDVYKNDKITERISFMRATATPEEIERFRLEPDDVLITKDSESWNDIGIPALVEYTADDLVCGYHLASLRPRKTLIRGPFLLRALQCPEVAFQFHVAANGVTRYGLSHESIKSVLLPVSPLTEQANIAAFLDCETAKLDALIAKKERLIELLREKRAALISHAVTKGLDPSAPMKDSKIEWLGDIPVHWNVLKFSREIHIAKGQIDPEVEPYLSMLLIAPNHIESGTGRLLLEQTASEQSAQSGKYQCSAGDIIYSKIRPALAKITIAPRNCLCSADMYPMSGSSRIVNPYLLWLFLSKQFTAWSILEADRVAMPKINRETLNELRMPVPSLSEQRAIADYLDHEEEKVNKIIVKVRLAIEHLLEYRTALISAAVTGKIDVRREVA
jgi:type I restriction enzyme S subunit